MALGVFAGRGWLLIVGALVVMIFLHELGHYLTAKWAGMKVTEFFIGFGPKIWSFRRGETEYGIKCIPPGAYVRIIGMSNLDEVPPEDEPRTYRQQSYPQRLLVVVGRLDDALPAGLRAASWWCSPFSASPAGGSLAQRLGGPAVAEDGLDDRQRGGGLGGAGSRAPARATIS